THRQPPALRRDRPSLPRCVARQDLGRAGRCTRPAAEFPARLETFLPLVGADRLPRRALSRPPRHRSGTTTALNQGPTLTAGSFRRLPGTSDMTIPPSVSCPVIPKIGPLPSSGPGRRRSWRLGWLALALLLVAAVPLPVCMPLFSDVIQHDLSARIVLQGGVHYRDVFDTNPPGIVWIHVALRSLLGWSSEAFRLADLANVSAIIWLLVRWLRLLGRSPAGVVWAAVGVFG